MDDWRAIGGGRRGCEWASAEDEAMLTFCSVAASGRSRGVEVQLGLSCQREVQVASGARITNA